MKTPILCVNFDGVLHSYTSGWKGPRCIPDEPVPGAIEWLRSLLSDPECICCMAPRYLDYDVRIYSNRSRCAGGRRAMKKWLKRWFNYYCFEPSIVDELLKFPKEKPPATIFIDDRVFQFEGRFPTVEEMHSLRESWIKKKAFTTLNSLRKENKLLTILVGNVGCGKSRYAQEQAIKENMVIINMDYITEMVGGRDNNYDLKKKPIYWAIEEKAITESLERGFSVIIDRTNMDKKRRKRFIDIGKRYPWVSVLCLDWGKGKAQDLRRRLDNPGNISEQKWTEVFNTMQYSYELPSVKEGFDFILIQENKTLK